MEQGSRSSNNNEGESLLRILRDLEAALNANATEAITTTERPQSEDHVDAEHLVSSMTVNMIELENVLYVRELQNITENVGLRELHEEWIDRTRIRINRGDEIGQNEESDEDYLPTFRLAENVIVIRFIYDFRSLSDGIVQTQIIWNSKFSWRDIKQHLENDTYKFYFKYEIVSIGIPDSSDDSEEEESDAEEVWVNSSVRAAIDALPAVISPQEQESGDVLMCTICHDTFSTGDSSKQLPCTHCFHAMCILLWFHRKHSCPICRREVVLQQDNLVVLNLNGNEDYPTST